MTSRTYLNANALSLIKSVIIQALAQGGRLWDAYDVDTLRERMTNHLLTPDPVDVVRTMATPLGADVLSYDGCMQAITPLSAYRERAESLALSAYHTYEDVTLYNVGSVSIHIAALLFLRDHGDSLLDKSLPASGAVTLLEVSSILSDILKNNAWEVADTSAPATTELSDKDKVYWFNRSAQWVEDNGGVAEMKAEAEGSSTAPYDLFYSFLGAVMAR